MTTRCAVAISPTRTPRYRSGGRPSARTSSTTSAIPRATRHQRLRRHRRLPRVRRRGGRRSGDRALLRRPGPGHHGDKTLNKCQHAIGKATSAFLSSKSKALQKCWDAKLNGEAIASCVPPLAGDGKYLAAIAKAETKKIATICKACGGADKGCDQAVTTPTTTVLGTGGSDDLTPADRFPGDLPRRHHSGRAVELRPTDQHSRRPRRLRRLRHRVQGRLRRPAAGAAVRRLPGRVWRLHRTGADRPVPDDDGVHRRRSERRPRAGWTGLAHNAKVPTNGRITLASAGATTRANRPAVSATSTARSRMPAASPSTIVAVRISRGCSAPPTATASRAGATGPCIFFFGSPLPLVAGGVSTCVVNEITGPVTGTINLDDGNSMTIVPLASKVHRRRRRFRSLPAMQRRRLHRRAAHRPSLLGQPVPASSTGTSASIVRPIPGPTSGP